MAKKVPQRKNKVKPGKGAKKGTTKATGRDYTSQARFNATPEQKKKRAELNRINRQRGTYGNGDKLDVSHNKDGSVKKASEPQSKNRARNGKNSTRRRKRTKD